MQIPHLRSTLLIVLVPLLVLSAFLAPGLLKTPGAATGASQPAPEGTIPTEMRATLMSRADRYFGSSVALATPKFVAANEEYVSLRSAEIGSADFMYADFAQPDGRSWRLYT
jgi:hypothetical protein